MFSTFCFSLMLPFWDQKEYYTIRRGWKHNEKDNSHAVYQKSQISAKIA